MAIGKWCMYLSAVLFLIIGLGSLAVAVIPGADNWFVDETIDATTGDAFDDPFFDESGDAIDDAVDDSNAVKLTAWILAATFLPTALLFVWIGRWFGSMQRDGFGGIAYPGMNPAGVPAAGVPTTGVPHTSPMPTGEPPVPDFKDPVGPPPENFVQ